MGTQLITKRTVTIKEGMEGPRQDPYGFIEATVETNLHTVKFHEGLAIWVEVDGDRLHLTYKQSRLEFTRLTGFADIADVQKALDKLAFRQMNPCCRKHSEWLSGYPGESLLICSKCHKVVGYDFNESAIM